MSQQENIPNQYLMYDFTYEGKRHKGKILLDEDAPGVQMMYDDHDLEITWEKRIRHAGKEMVLNIVVKDDWNDMESLGKVVASAWVCISDRHHGNIIDQLEPDNWAYIDEENDRNNVSKETFYNSH